MTTKKSSADLPEDRLLAAVAYFGVTCVLPLALRPKSAFAQHHGKQGLVLLIVGIGLWVVNVIPVLGQLVWFFGTIGVVILGILGIINALGGQMWEMPLLGKYAKMFKF